MANVFDGASGVTCGDKEIQSITVDGDVLYEKNSEE